MHARFGAAVLAAIVFSIPPRASAQDITGAWVLRPHLGTSPEQAAGFGRPGPSTPGEHGGAGGDGGMGGGGRGMGGGGGRGGMGGGGGRGGMGGGRGGMGGGMMGGGGISEQDRARMRAMARLAREAPERLTITREASTFTFADATGRTWPLTADGRKRKRLTGDGELSSKARLDGTALVVEETLGGPVKLEYRYVPETEGDVRRLRVLVSVTGGPQARSGRAGSPRALVRVYELATTPPAW
ncbi:MAG: hypothetical protein IT179_14710 [Acidobacteria bacterium]|nr:hypothetical protein [Acidobacteriota bacterium]